MVAKMIDFILYSFCNPILNVDGSVSVQDMMDYFKISDKTVYARIKKSGGEFRLEKGRIFLVGDGESDS